MEIQREPLFCNITYRLESVISFFNLIHSSLLFDLSDIMWHCSSLAPPLSQLLRKQATFLLSLVTHLNMLQSFIFTKLIVSHKVQPHSLYVVTQKGRSYIPWNPTSPRKAHGNVFIRNDFPSMCRGIFPHCCVLWERTKLWGAWAPKRTISTQLGWDRYR